MKSSKLEYRFTDFKPVEGRTVSGVVIAYGANGLDPISRNRETFESRAFGDISDTVFANVNHDRNKIVAVSGNGLDLTHSDTGLLASIQIPENAFGNSVLEKIREGVYKGFSVEFRAIKESFIDGVRTISKATLEALSIVRTPAYPDSRIVEVRNLPDGREYLHIDYLRID